HQNTSIKTKQQQREIKGKVTDENGEPLQGVTVSVESTDKQTSTDNESEFELPISQNDGALLFSNIGYKSHRHVLANEREVNIILQNEVTGLDELVVVGYGTMEKKMVTSSITSLKEEDLMKGMGGATIASSLQGKIPGMTISGTSSSNSANDFQLRGVASINASQSPLVVVDGIPGADIRSLIIEDIQSVDVLKDASAGAIYGTRAAGGVILITTKKGREGKLSLTFTNEASKQRIIQRPRVLSKERFLEYGM